MLRYVSTQIFHIIETLYTIWTSCYCSVPLLLTDVDQSATVKNGNPTNNYHKTYVNKSEREQDQLIHIVGTVSMKIWKITYRVVTPARYG